MPVQNPIAACKDHAEPTRWGQMAHTMAQAREFAAHWIEYTRRHRDTVPADFLADLIINDGPPCCPSAGLARSFMSWAYRELLAGEG